MPIDHFRKAIFVHIPKTAGTSIEQALGLYGGECTLRLFGRQMQHYTAPVIESRIRERIFQEYFKFCFVRNPWDRLVSEYFFLTKNKVIDCEFKQICEPRFLLNEKHPQFLKDHLRPQSDYIFSASGQSLVDFVGRFENLESDWNKVCIQLSCDVELPITKKSQRSTYQSYYDEESINWIAEVYAEDIARFEYTF